MINRFLGSALATLSLLLVASTTQGHAQSSAKTVTLVVPYAAGGGTDTVARLIGERMSRTLGQVIIVENQVGGGSTIANDRVARSAPDGTTILINHVGLLAAPNLFTNLRYDTMTAFEPVGLVNIAPMLLIGRKSIPGSTPQEFVAWIKAQGDKANFAHGGIGSNSHLCAVMIGNVLGFKPTIVAYRGSGPAIADMAGRTDRPVVRSGHQRVAAGSGRHAARHRDHVVGTSRTVKGRADHRRTRHAPGQLFDVAWALRRQGHAEGNRRGAERGAPRGAGRSGLASQLKELGTLPFPDDQLSPEAHARLFAADMPRVAKLVESSGIKASEAK